MTWGAFLLVMGRAGLDSASGHPSQREISRPWVGWIGTRYRGFPRLACFFLFLDVSGATEGGEERGESKSAKKRYRMGVGEGQKVQLQKRRYPDFSQMVAPQCAACRSPCPVRWQGYNLPVASIFFAWSCWQDKPSPGYNVGVLSRETQQQ